VGPVLKLPLEALLARGATVIVTQQAATGYRKLASGKEYRNRYVLG